MAHCDGEHAILIIRESDRYSRLDCVDSSCCYIVDKGGSFMTIEEKYQIFGGNYSELIERVYSEKSAERLLQLFLQDTGYEMFVSAMEQGDYEEAQKEIHGLKGVAANLAMTPLYQSAIVILNALRAGKITDAKANMPILKEQYEKIVTVILK